MKSIKELIIVIVSVLVIAVGVYAVKNKLPENIRNKFDVNNPIVGVTNEEFVKAVSTAK